MILAVGPNPAVDRTAHVERLVLGEPVRPTEVVALPGGKALNVGRAARALGALVTTSGIVGGHAGRWLVEQAAAEGLSPRFVETTAETRTTYVVTDGRGRSVVVYEPSVEVDPATLEELVALLERELLGAARRVVLAGSLPRGVDREGFARLVETCRAAGRWCLLDTSGDGLVAALAARPDVAKISLDEGREAGLAGARAGAAAVARALVERGAGIGIVTDGARGAWAWDGRRGWHAPAPRVAAVSAIGSGDAFGAGLVVAIDAGASLEEGLAAGSAAGAANALSLGAGRLDPVVQAQLAATVRVVRDG